MQRTVCIYNQKNITIGNAIIISESEFVVNSVDRLNQSNTGVISVKYNAEDLELLSNELRDNPLSLSINTALF